MLLLLRIKERDINNQMPTLSPISEMQENLRWESDSWMDQHEDQMASSTLQPPPQGRLSDSGERAGSHISGCAW